MSADSQKARTDAIAIVGMSGRFPGAPTPDVFWEKLRDGVELISFYTDEELKAQGIDSAKLSDPNFVRARPYLEGRETFDAGFFGFSGRDAELIDPQQRLFLEVAWEALEHAGYVPERFPGLIGVFAGSGANMYLWFNLLVQPQFLQRTGLLRTVISSGADFLAARAAYKMNLTGPVCSVQTACSTALVAVHLACQSLRDFECDLALAGATSLNVLPFVGYNYETGGLMSRDGHCRAFDARGSGTLFGDGLGAVVLKRLDEAIEDRDTIHAVILGSAVNNDGDAKAGFTAPAATGQAAVVFQALDNAGVPADSVSYVEAHGTATELGDAIEVKALTSAFRSSTTKKGFCAIGSVKTNLGHLNAAAGIAGLMKTVLALEHRQIPPSLHFETPNPGIDFAGSPFFVNDRLRDWAPGATPRRAGISAFGIGGTNAHVIVEEAPAPAPPEPSRASQLVVLSARSDAALARAAAGLAAHLEARGGQRQTAPAPLADVAFTLTQGRRSLPAPAGARGQERGGGAGGTDRCGRSREMDRRAEGRRWTGRVPAARTGRTGRRHGARAVRTGGGVPRRLRSRPCDCEGIRRSRSGRGHLSRCGPRDGRSHPAAPDGHHPGCGLRGQLRAGAAMGRVGRASVGDARARPRRVRGGVPGRRDDARGCRCGWSCVAAS